MQTSGQVDIKQLGTILSVWAHPDDETFACGGILAAAIQNGQEVICITATKGELGVQDEARWPAAELAEIRKNELEQALKILGVSKHHWLGYKDGECASADEVEAINKLAGYIGQYHPDSIITFGPDGWTGHDDHRAVSAWTGRAIDQSRSNAKLFYVVETKEHHEKYMLELDSKFNFYFNTSDPPVVGKEDCDVCYDLPETICGLKCASLAAMPSQTEKILEYLGGRAKEVFSQEALVCAR